MLMFIYCKLGWLYDLYMILSENKLGNLESSEIF